VVLPVFLAYVLMESTDDGTSIGAAMVLLPLLLISLPGSVIAAGGGVPFDGAALLGTLVNGLVLAWWVSRRPAAAGSRYRSGRLMGVVLAATSLTLLGSTLALAVTSRQIRADLSRQVAGVSPVEPWTAAGTEVDSPDCAFCSPRSAFVRSVFVDGPVPEEQVLLALVDARMSRQGFRPDMDWDCASLDSEDPRTAERLCARGYVREDVNAFLRVYEYEAGDPELWVDINRLS
jgi:hypothetical protein